jgi:hypothetical protein
MNCHASQDRQWVPLIAVALVLGGCGGMPKNAEEFRQFTLERTRVLGALSVPKETFEVERPFRDVSSTLQKKADECLKVAIKWTVTNSYGNTRSGVDTFKPTFIAGPNKAELHVQLKRSAVVEVGAPPDGAYRVVLDATPLTAKRTRIEMYALSIDDKLVRQTLRGWAQGTNLGCPDLAKR